MAPVKALATKIGGNAPCPRVAKMVGSESLKLTQADIDMIEAAVKAFHWSNKSDILRTALRVGLESLIKDHSPLGKPPLSPSEFRLVRGPGSETLQHPQPADDTSLTGKSAKELAAEADRLDRSEAQTELDSPAAREAAGKKPRRKR